MPYCPKCGREVEEDAKFCPSCGVDLKAETYTYRRTGGRGWNIGRVLMVLFGVMIILVSLGMMAGGAGILTIESTFTDEAGYLVSHIVNLETDSYALVSPSVPIDLNIPNSWLIPQVDDWLSVKIIASNNNLGKPLFIAVANSGDLDSYLDDVAYTTVSNIRYSYDPNEEPYEDIRYTHHSGGAPSINPNGVYFWDVTESGLGAQELKWTPISGEYVLVGMNADGSKGLDVNVQFGVKLPVVIRNIGYGLIAGGLIILLIGLFVINAVRRY